MLHRQRASAAVALAMMAGLVTACSSGPSDTGGLTTITYGLPTTTYSITTVGIQYAISQGFFKDEGINVEVKPLNGSTTPIRALLNGDIDVGQTGPDTATLAVIAGSPLTVIASPQARDAGVVIGNAPIKSMSDLKGKTYAISAPGSSSATQIQAQLLKYGVNPADVNMVALGAPDARVRALLANKVDATGATILVLQPVLDAIAAGKVNILARSSDDFPDLPLSWDVVTSKMASQKRDLLVRFVRAEFKGYVWALANPEAAAKVAAQFITDTPEALITSAIKQLKDMNAFGIDGLTYAGINRTEQAMVNLKIISKKVDSRDISDPSISQEALGKPIETPAPSASASAPGTTAATPSASASK